MDALVDLTLIEPSYEAEVSKQLEGSGIPACFGDMLLSPLFEQEVLEIDELAAAPVSGREKNKKNIALDEVVPSASSLADTMFLSQDGYELLSNHKRDKIARTVAKAQHCVSCKVYVQCNMLTNNMLLYKISEKDPG